MECFKGVAIQINGETEFILKIPLTKAAINAEDMRALNAAVGSPAMTQGQITAAFEEKFAQYLGASGCVATNSGTSALILALRTLDVWAGDEVILPSYTCIAILHAVVQSGATPVLTDNACVPSSMDYNMTVDHVSKVLSNKTKAIIVPHMFGVPAKIDELIQIGVPVIEDITLSLGARYKEKPIGGWGVLSVCSFHASKMISCGEGGMLAATSRDLYKRARFLNGWESEQVDLRFSRRKPDPYELRYNFHMSDITATLGLSQLSRLHEFISRRRLLAREYTRCLKKLSVITPDIGESPNVFFRYLVFLENMDILEILNAYAEVGIEAGRGVYPALHNFFNANPDNFPGAEKAMSAVLSIPLYPALKDEEVEYILRCSVDILSRGRTL